MKIGYFADGPWSHTSIEKIVEDQDLDIEFIVPRFNNQDPVLKEWAKRLKIDFLPFKDINHKDSTDIINSYEADIHVSMSFNQIFKKEIIDIAPKGFINCHAGALPFYRGRNILNWVLINDEKEFGVTVHYVDEGIDTGKIILQKKYPITDKDDYSTLLERATFYCAEVLYDSLITIKNNNVQVISQNSIDKEGSYCPRRKEGDEWIDWDWSSRKIFNFVRAITKPGPMARANLNSEIVLFKSCIEVEKVDSFSGKEGQIVKICEDYILIKTIDGIIKILFDDLYILESDQSFKKIFKEKIILNHIFKGEEK